MNIRPNIRWFVWVALLFLFAGRTGALAGHPVWPPPKHSVQYRQANMLFLRFQDALAAERWLEALSLCSDRVQAKAATWPSPQAFFADTLPVDLLLSQDFGYWTIRSDQPGGFEGRDRATCYGLFVPLTAPESKPELQWYWAILATNNTWVVDYPPVKLDDYVAGKRRAIREQENRLEQIRRRIDVKVRSVDVHLGAVSPRFVIGAPMLFRLDVTNRSEVPIQYQDSGVAFAPLTVRDHKGEPLPFTVSPSQIAVRWGIVGPGASLTLTDKIDLSRQYAITKPGKYSVQFNGPDLQVGERVASTQEPGLFGENESARIGGFVSATNRFVSNVIEIEVREK